MSMTTGSRMLKGMEYKRLINQGQLVTDCKDVVFAEGTSLKKKLISGGFCDSTLTNMYSNMNRVYAMKLMTPEEVESKYYICERVGIVKIADLKAICELFGLNWENYILKERPEPKPIEVPAEETIEIKLDPTSKETNDWLAVIAETLDEMVHLMRDDHDLLVQLNQTVSFKKPPVVG